MKNYKDDFLDYLKNNRNYTISTIKTYDAVLIEVFEYADFVADNDGKYTLDLSLYRKSMLNQSSATIAKKLSCIRSFVEYIKLGGMSVNILSNDSVHVVKEHFEAISSSSIKKALSIASIEEKILIYLIYNYGLRISEISNIKISDFNNNCLSVNSIKKSREIPLEVGFLKLIDNFLSQNERNCYLFEKNEKKLSENSLRYILSKCFKKVELKTNPQQLRYSLISDMLTEGARVEDIKELLGNKSYSMVLPQIEFSNTKKIKAYKTIHPMCKDDYGHFN